MIRVYLTKDIDKVGFAGEIIKVKEGYATNFIIPNKLGILVTAQNEASLLKKLKTVENRKEAVKTKTSMLAEKIKSLKLTYKTKTHDGNKLYGAVSASDVMDLLKTEGIVVAKNQVIFDKSIKNTGTFEVIVKLSNQLQPTFQLKVQSIE